jgi:hypothetical protein
MTTQQANQQATSEEVKKVKKGRGKDKESVPLFDQFWQTYPCKVAKAAARKAWNIAIGRATAETIIAAASEYAASDVGKSDFAKHPATWLNGECWDDDRKAWERRERAAGPEEHKPALPTAEQDEKWNPYVIVE